MTCRLLLSAEPGDPRLSLCGGGRAVLSGGDRRRWRRVLRAMSSKASPAAACGLTSLLFKAGQYPTARGTSFRSRLPPSTGPGIVPPLADKQCSCEHGSQISFQFPDFCVWAPTGKWRCRIAGGPILGQWRGAVMSPMATAPSSFPPAVRRESPFLNLLTCGHPWQHSHVSM